MNGATQSVKPDQQPILLQALSYQHDIDKQTEDAFSGIRSAIARLDNIANRLNSKDYPKNFPPDQPSSGSVKIDERGAPSKPDGLFGAIVDINERSQGRINQLSQFIIPDLLAAISYLEQHI